MVFIKTGKTFVYGEFTSMNMKKLKGLGGLPHPPGWHEFAIEILREFSPTQLVGKLYSREGTTWLPVDPARATRYDWYESYTEGKPLHFDMAGSGLWRVLHFRDESDENGPYIAVALEHSPRSR
ncbi:MAG: hypothetical protein DMG05_02705 [Acidobacteria bacterium]|nr:MAG: hypothetical protein DMG05_02705 [Acidobacteriota bacterium]